MSAERIIGVDFGTSTSVIRVKRYQDGKPIGDPMETKPVTFNMGSTMVPTLIQRLSTGGTYFGYDAEVPKKKAETFLNFKMNIENTDEGIRRQARELTAEYFTYLAKSYRTQSEGGHLGESSDKERTIISYPVKWSDETKAFMLRTAQDAGFPNVEGIDEAQAAIQAVTVQNADLLTGKGYFQDGVPVNILLIDMGAGTTDLILCRHTPGKQPKTDILNTWPKGDRAPFGGREVDGLLRNYIYKAMPEDGADVVLKKVGLEKFKAWKESVVSPALEKGETVDTFAALDTLLDVLGIEVEYSIDRGSFETYVADYLCKFPELVNGCVHAAGMSGDNIDLVILTGGHSRWYFVREMLCGTLDRFGKIGMGKIQADPKRVIPISLPQETVALGLVYGPLKAVLPSPSPKKETQKVTPPPSGEVFPLQYSPYQRIRPVIAAGARHTVGLKKDGTVVAVGDKDFGICNVSDWRNIVAIAAGHSYTMGLKRDGTVLAVGYNGEEGRCNVNDWRDIVAIAAGSSHTVGLKKDGTVVAVGSNSYGQCNVSEWRDIVAIAAGYDHTVGLRKDGTVVAIGYNKYGECDVHDWRDIVAIATFFINTVGLKRDGTVIAVGSNEKGQCDMSDWRDIVAIAVGGDYKLGRGRVTHTVGLRKNGTVVAVGSNRKGECNVSEWRDIVAIAAGVEHTVGLKENGTVVAVGSDEYGETDVGEFKTVKTLFGKFKSKQEPWKLF